MPDVTQILSNIESGDSSAAEELLPLVYEELRRLAAARMANERPDHTLQATSLVHEAYMRLVDVNQAKHWDSRGHFFAAAAEAMRRILVDDARRKDRPKHGAGLQRVELSAADLGVEHQQIDLLALNEALEKLEAMAPRQADLIKLRFFAGLTCKQAALALGIADSTADLDWAYAKTWLRVEMSGGTPAALKTEEF